MVYINSNGSSLPSVSSVDSSPLVCYPSSSPTVSSGNLMQTNLWKGLITAPFLIRCSPTQLSLTIDLLAHASKAWTLKLLQMSHSTGLLASVYGLKVINMHVIQQVVYPSCTLQWSGGTLLSSKTTFQSFPTHLVFHWEMGNSSMCQQQLHYPFHKSHRLYHSECPSPQSPHHFPDPSLSLPHFKINNQLTKLELQCSYETEGKRDFLCEVRQYQ